MKKVNELEMRMLEAGAFIDFDAKDNSGEPGLELTLFGYTLRINLINEKTGSFRGISLYDNEKKRTTYFLLGINNGTFVKFLSLKGYTQSPE